LSRRSAGAAAKAKTKLSQIQQNPAKPAQRKSKKKAWISLDFLVRIKPFQGVAATPVAKKSFPVPFPRQGPLAIAALHSATGSRYHEF
jgi:hypothetical protein